MTEWLKLERLPGNDLPIPRYESEHSAGIDLSACLMRPCRHIPEGATYKQSRPFLCCDPNQPGSHKGEMFKWSKDDDLHRLAITNSRLPINPEIKWEYIKAPTIRLAVWPGETVMIPLGLKCEFGSSYVLMLHVRSSTGMRGLELANQTGIIDPDYRGELWAVVYNRNRETPIIIEHGDRIIQGVMLGFNQAIITETTVGKTNRGEGGFGSTGVTTSTGLEKGRDVL